ncbi:hypothetical protein CEXT_620881 [Caerostris extrusa]|uniref:Uncharacterized protein n=1 Tax=Caerostris extrusa TaxID=172846 RepID=A0AAV4NJR5_CAEEX|nr:hypothetical protein CEXT_620881 [Caerostris extrusa]
MQISAPPNNAPSQTDFEKHEEDTNVRSESESTDRESSGFVPNRGANCGALLNLLPMFLSMGGRPRAHAHARNEMRCSIFNEISPIPMRNHERTQNVT